ncbi:unnamed protein product [Paramecium sonneborni]|uniref:Uncharacterized protein n=1 Tax=Paramecium sonneborni TaxID=65129 RepID=A0A8S1K1Y5_9CILI|nr:unnamed protein product [Paramecium sonneborni]
MIRPIVKDSKFYELYQKIKRKILIQYGQKMAMIKLKHGKKEYNLNKIMRNIVNDSIG